MNVLINCLSSKSGGAISYLRNMLPLLIERFNNSEHKLILLMFRDQEEFLNKLTVDVIWVDDAKKSLFNRLIWERLNQQKIIDKYYVNIVFVPYQIFMPVKRAKSVIMVRNMEPFTFHRYKYGIRGWFRNVILKRMTIRSINSCAGIIAVSKYVESHIGSYITRNAKICQIYHGRDKSFHHEKEESDCIVLNDLGITEKYIFTCGSLLPYRNCQSVIEAYAEVVFSAENVDFNLIVAGDSNDKSYKKKILNLIDGKGLGDRVQMLGHVSKNAMQVLYRNSELFITATETEACPNIAIEAMSSGCRILSVNSMPMPEMFGDSAIYFNGNNAQEIKSLILDCMSSSNSDSTHKYHKASLVRANKFSWDECAEETYKFLLKLI